MRKIPTLFVRDDNDRAHVLPTVTPGCEWVLDGEGTPTRKYDGTCIALDNQGRLWVRREVKKWAQPPENFKAEQLDEITGKLVGWEPVTQSGWTKYVREAISNKMWEPGTYELCGPKVNGNPEGFQSHELIRHGAVVLAETPRDFDGLAKWMSETNFEGIVWHHPDGRMAKLKKRDFPK